MYLRIKLILSHKMCTTFDFIFISGLADQICHPQYPPLDLYDNWNAHKIYSFHNFRCKLRCHNDLELFLRSDIGDIVNKIPANCLIHYKIKFSTWPYSIWTYSSFASVTLMRSVDTRVGRMAPKKSVMGTLCGSRRYRSLRTPTVDMHTRLGHTCSCRVK